MNPDPKSGWRTTEFWLNLAAVIVAYLLTTDMVDDPDTMIARVLTTIAMILAAFGYTVARSVVKAKVAKANGR